MNRNNRILKRIISITGFVFCLSLLAGCGKEKSSGKSLTRIEGSLIIGTEFGYPPFEYLDNDGLTLIGFDVDMWNEMCRRMNVNPVFSDTQWAGLFPALETNRYDCIISAVTITPERQEKFLVTKPYVQNSECFIVNKNRHDMIDSPEKLNGLKVAYQAETVSDVYVTTMRENGLNCEVFEYEKLLNAFDDLQFGRVDVVVAESVASKNITKNNSESFRIDFIGEPDAFFGVLVNKNNPELFETIQKTMDEMYADGWMKANEEKWLHIN